MQQSPVAPSPSPAFAALLCPVQLLVVIHRRTESPKQLVKALENRARALAECRYRLGRKFSGEGIRTVGFAMRMPHLLMWAFGMVVVRSAGRTRWFLKPDRQ
ncbi:hypothetical protein A6A29_40840 [Streptomyces sp. TSRI0281]|nr:hypothetical protein A6A29_40840 [Streptomyces sp. TSRI0281]